MSERTKKIVLGVLGVLVALFAADQLWTRMVVEPRDAAEAKLERGRESKTKMRLQIKAAQKEVDRLEAWRKRSLPADVQSARTLYQGWLHKLVDGAKLEQRYIDSSSPIGRTGYRVLPFTLRGVGTMDQLTELLYAFYRAPHLHRIRTLSISPIGSSSKLDLSFAIETLIVDGCDRVDMLATGEGTSLASDDLNAYRVLSERNLFGRSPTVGVAELTELTAVVTVDGVAEAWVMNRMEDTMQKLRVGDHLSAGWFQGEIVEIEGDDVVLDSDGDRWLLTRGDPLSEAIALPPEY